MLVIAGGTNLGKSMLAASVLRRIAKALNLADFLEVTVESDTNLDLSAFHLLEHAGVLLDGVGDALMLKTHRETLQGRIKKCRGGKSATMKFSYAFTLCRRAVVVTMDLSARNLHMFSTDHWLSDPKNVLLLNLAAPAWEHAAPQAIPTLAPMEAWPVEAVANWLEAKDMAGPAAYFRSQGVNGRDLVAFSSAQTLSEELKTTLFVARKVLVLRDEHAAGHA